jgi:ATP-dependent protease ClpP protease subunit
MFDLPLKKMFVDPHKNKTEIFINGEIVDEIKGSFKDQAEIIKKMIEKHNIEYLHINSIGVGVALNDLVEPWFNEYILESK